MPGVDRSLLRLLRRGELRGARYWLRGDRPSSDVPDEVVAERVRAELGEQRVLLDGARLRVEVLDHIVYLRGHVPSEGAAHGAAAVVMAVPGVDGLQSYVRVARGGPGPQPARAVEQPSPKLARLLAAARAAGFPPPQDGAAVHAVLGTLAGRVPIDELLHLWAHLPADVCSLLSPPVTFGEPPRRLRREEQLHAAVRAAGADGGGDVARLVHDVLVELQALVPEEVHDVASVLPAGIRPAWPVAPRPPR